MGLLEGLALAFWLTGAGAWLAARVAGGGGIWGYALFVLLCVATYEALTFPITRMAGIALDGDGEGFGPWFFDYLFAMVLELGVITAAAVAGRWLWEFLGGAWWLGGTAAYLVMSPDMWPLALRLGGRRAEPVPDPPWLARVQSALDALGRRRPAGVAVYDGGERGPKLRDAHYFYSKHRAPTLVFLRGAWEDAAPDALVFLAVWEGVRRKLRRGGRLFSVAVAALVLWGAGRAVGASGFPGGLGSAPAFPAFVVWFFAFASVGGILRNGAAKIADAIADRAACRALGGTAEMRAWADAAERRADSSGPLPWWTEILQDSRRPSERLQAVQNRIPPPPAP
ncbi:MAG: hypothetical protein IK066_01240 [Kiritimatiellae bacterium]|nr:hypothetical protein [Kiritimatiellia bacterium]